MADMAEAREGLRTRPNSLVDELGGKGFIRLDSRYSTYPEASPAEPPEDPPEASGERPQLNVVDDGLLDDHLSQKVSTVKSTKLISPSVISKLPSEDAVTTSRNILSERITLYGLQEKKVKGDGNCQFRSISDQLYRTPSYHRDVRERIVSRLRDKAGVYKGYVPEDYQIYLKDMERSGTWGDHVTLKAAADVYGVRIIVLSSYDNHEASIIEVDPEIRFSRRVLYLSFWAEIHYNSLYPDDEPIPDNGNEKVLGSKLLFKWLSWGLSL